MTTTAAGNLKTIINISKPEAQPDSEKIDTVKIIGESTMVLMLYYVVSIFMKLVIAV